MGKVYPWADVKARRVPKIEDFPRVIDHIREIFKHEQSLLGGLICGSVLRGDHTRRSDIDCVVVYDTVREREALRALQNISRFAGDLYVPVGFVPCDLYTAGTRFHHLGPAFRIHLSAAIANGGIIGTDPLTLLGSSGDDMHMEIESYLRMQIYRIEEGLTKYPCMPLDRQCDFLQKMLEAPSHVARKVLHLYASDADDSKSAIARRYALVMPKNLSEHMGTLLYVDARYTTELENQLDHPDGERYSRCWSALEDMPYHVLDFVRGNIRYIAESR